MAEESAEHEEARAMEKEIWGCDLQNLKAQLQERLQEPKQCRDLWSGQVQGIPP